MKWTRNMANNINNCLN